MDTPDYSETVEPGIPLKMSYELPGRSEVPSLTETVANKLRNGMELVLIPVRTIRGISKTVSRDNPLCAASVRFNAETIFGIKLEPRGTAEKLMEHLVDQILAGKREGAVGSDISEVVSKWYTSFIIYMNSAKHPESGHLAKAFRKIDGEVLVIDTEIKIGKNRTGQPIPLETYLGFLEKIGRRISSVVGLPTDRVAI